MGLLNIVVIIALVGTAFAEIADIVPCDSEQYCTVTQARISPCDKKNRKCSFKRGSDVTLEFDYDPKFDASELETGVYWENGAMDIPFAGLESSNGCTYTSCPVQTGQPGTLTYNLHIGKKLPLGPFLIKWKLWKKDEPTHVCCFKTLIGITKK